MTAEQSVYLNGEFLPTSEAKVSVLDRGFLFGDGVYEVIPVYGGRLFRLSRHLQRLHDSLAAIRLSNPLSDAQWQQILQELVERNGCGDQSLYLQITRGVGKREHAFPATPSPTLFAMSTPVSKAVPIKEDGICAITVEDIRWRLCQIKAITLLPNVLLHQQALDAGAGEAIMLRDGKLSEGSASNVFVVSNGVVATPPSSNLLLPGITRDLILELCQRHHVPCEVRTIDEGQLRNADEIWLTSSTRGIIPVIELDGSPLSAGRPGPLWELINSHYQAYITAFREGREE